MVLPDLFVKAQDMIFGPGPGGVAEAGEGHDRHRALRDCPSSRQGVALDQVEHVIGHDQRGQEQHEAVEQSKFAV